MCHINWLVVGTGVVAGRFTCRYAQFVVVIFFFVLAISPGGVCDSIERWRHYFWPYVFMTHVSDKSCDWAGEGENTML